MKLKLIILLHLFFISIATNGHSQIKYSLYKSAEENYYAIASDYSFWIHDSTFHSHKYYSKKEEGLMTLWDSKDGTPLFPAKVKEGELIQSLGFEIIETFSDQEPLRCEVAVVDSFEGEMKPCGQAKYAEPVIIFKFLVKIYFSDQIIFEREFQEHSFHLGKIFDGESHSKSFLRNLQIWHDESTGKYYSFVESTFATFRVE